jgi:hypothetical protein
LPERCKYTDTLLKVDLVSLSYGDKIILRDVNAEIRDIVRTDFSHYNSTMQSSQHFS